MIKGIIYKYTSPSDKIYIGQTIDEKGRRQKFLNEKNLNYAGDKINKARLKYGPENFLYEVIFSITSDNIKEVQDVLDIKEKEYIKLYDSFKNGYNSTKGGDCSYIRTEKSKKLISNKLKEYYKDHECPVSKIVLQYDLDGNFIREWPSGRKAALALGLVPNRLTEVCNGNGYTCGNYMWRYKESNDIELKIERPPVKSRNTIVIEYTVNGIKNRVWKSITEASEQLGYSVSNFSLYCNGKDNHYYNGYLYYRYEPETPPIYTGKKKLKRNISNKPKPVF